jgi:hypothetical protein
MMIEKELNMKGSIRAGLGFLVVFAAVGGIDNATDGQLVTLLPIALAGLALMASGVFAMKGSK